MAKNKMTKDEAILLLVNATCLEGGIFISRKEDIVGSFEGDHGSGPDEVIDQAETKEDGSINWSQADGNLKRLVSKVQKLDKDTKLSYVMAEEAEDFILFSKEPKPLKGVTDDARQYRYENIMIPVGKITEKDAVLIFAMDG